MTRLTGIIVFIALAAYLHSSGLLFNITHDLQPETGRQCEVRGAAGHGCNLAYKKDDVKSIIDTRIGTPMDRAASEKVLNSMIRDEQVVHIPEFAEVKVLGAGFVTLYGCRYAVAKVQVVSGAAADTTGWVERENVLDSPLFALYHSMRATKSEKRASAAAGMPDLSELQAACMEQKRKCLNNMRRAQEANQ